MIINPGTTLFKTKNEPSCLTGSIPPEEIEYIEVQCVGCTGIFTGEETGNWDVEFNLQDMLTEQSRHNVQISYCVPCHPGRWTAG
jgi:hypothetical protein